LVGVAVVISRVVMRLGQKVTQAREMGSYRLLTLLGKGGMGEVWRARHHMLARDAAIKLIQPDMLSPASGNAMLLRRRFEQEAKTTALLRSPHTMELYDFGVTRDGVFYYVMELLDGIDLETLVKRFGPLQRGL
jgi:eukaryotic-like serine/threonine-protein kinase